VRRTCLSGLIWATLVDIYPLYVFPPAPVLDNHDVCLFCGLVLGSNTSCPFFCFCCRTLSMAGLACLGLSVPYRSDPSCAVLLCCLYLHFFCCISSFLHFGLFWTDGLYFAFGSTSAVLGNPDFSQFLKSWVFFATLEATFSFSMRRWPRPNAPSYVRFGESSELRR